MSVTHRPAQPWQGRSDPEDGASALRLHNLVQEDSKRALIGFACDAGVRRNKGRVGAAEGPRALRAAMANLAAPSGAPGFSDLGDIVVTGDDLEEGQKSLSKALDNALLMHERILVLGGGHETAFASYGGLAARYPDERIGIINLDAHLDMRMVGANGPSSGTPFAQIRALDPAQFDYLCLGVAEESNTQALMQRADDWGVGIVSDHALITDRGAADSAITAMLERCDLLYLTIDIDLLPHFQAPGVSAPAARGVPLATVEHIVRYISTQSNALECPIRVADIVELSPPHDRDGVTAKTAALLARHLLLR